MSEITSIVIEHPLLDAFSSGAPDLHELIVHVRPFGEDLASRVPHLKALLERLGEQWNGLVLVLLGKRGEYLTSSIFLPLDDGERSAAHVRFSGNYRSEFERVLRFALRASTIGEVIFLSEPTYFFKGDDRTCPYATFPIIGPASLDRFLSMHDADELREQTIYRIVLNQAPSAKASEALIQACTSSPTA
jgi:hypothetical protein